VTLKTRDHRLIWTRGRAKRKIVSSGFAYRVPGPDELQLRLEKVLTVHEAPYAEVFTLIVGPA